MQWALLNIAQTTKAHPGMLLEQALVCTTAIDFCRLYANEPLKRVKAWGIKAGGFLLHTFCYLIGPPDLFDRRHRHLPLKF